MFEVTGIDLGFAQEDQVWVMLINKVFKIVPFLASPSLFQQKDKTLKNYSLLELQMVLMMHQLQELSCRIFPV